MDTHRFQEMKCIMKSLNRQKTLGSMQNNTFYKYKPINDFTLDSLKNKYFYYSRQEQLDDPFDMYTPVDTLKTNEEIKELFRRVPETAAIIYNRF